MRGRDVGDARRDPIQDRLVISVAVEAAEDEDQTEQRPNFDLSGGYPQRIPNQGEVPEIYYIC